MPINNRLKELRRQRKITTEQWEKMSMLTGLILDDDGKKRQLLIDRFLKIQKIKKKCQ